MAERQTFRGNRGSGLPLSPPTEMHIELTVEQAMFCIIAQTVTKPLPSQKYQATRSIQEQLKTAFGVDVTLRHIQHILRRWYMEDIICKTEQPLRLQVPIHGPRTICYQLKHPEKIFTVKKGKWDKRRHSNHGIDTP